MVTDRIDVWVDVASAAVAAAVETHKAYIAEQVLATSITMDAGADDLAVHLGHKRQVGALEGDHQAVRVPCVAPAIGAVHGQDGVEVLVGVGLADRRCRAERCQRWSPFRIGTVARR